ncbi:phosphate propanoyltransferase [Levilactobacillus brevis]|uniref:Phosphate propanoyltransferase n=2 Tax=Levilactobacillus brevis TaxID=1580 RepID=U2QXM9_LEVBR|nr:phosphate propanoyltransferase [Levilactobacillus brevis]ERK46048.1 propanediol utilization protein PduL [Levilactobacillus brevis ATCC 14869 = DSM 20054]KIO99197.1 Ethanolamine utilization protein similar to PduL [Levilactobacillus brevis]KRK21278.1 propanediol utilization protein [Levilactobacillus brevis ATCC 14869 = DSM 20054]MCT3571787.1 phosphate propanoyltransferase [Levilactobacillus brevis]PBQ24596.1 phosphate propanoyltransferase [Levilactobacillus brevis]
MTETDNLNEVVEAIVSELRNKTSFEIEASARHIHLDQATVEMLFGVGYQLTPTRPLSQPGQFVSKERLTLVGPNGKIENVAVLGPARKQSQVELSMTDARVLGIKPLLRESGHLKQTPGITLVSTNGQTAEIKSGVIVAQRHIHMSPDDARLFGVKNGDIVEVQTTGDRGLIFGNVVIRVSDRFATRMHIDFDEANACGLTKGMRGTIYKK